MKLTTIFHVGAALLAILVLSGCGRSANDDVAAEDIFAPLRTLATTPSMPSKLSLTTLSRLKRNLLPTPGETLAVIWAVSSTL